MEIRESLICAMQCFSIESVGNLDKLLLEIQKSNQLTQNEQ